MEKDLLTSLIEVGVNPYKGMTNFRNTEEYLKNVVALLMDKNMAVLEQKIISKDFKNALDIINYLKHRAAYLELDSLYFYLHILKLAVEERNDFRARFYYEKVQTVISKLESVLWLNECKASS